MTRHPKTHEQGPGPAPVATEAETPAGAEGQTDTIGEVESLREEVARLTREREDLVDLARRLQADFDNFRRRTRDEAVELRRTAAADLIRDLLPALDNLERALAAAGQGSDVETLRQGVALTRDQLFVALAGAGLEPVAAVGQRFDPALHEALERVEEEVSAGGPEEGAAPEELEVVEEFRRGYLVRGKLLRPSLVRVVAKVRRD